ncbi:ATP-dependent endonuclease [Luteimicrobium sp. NPDC057192]|uniref:ATP-dependent nuclease n=1 Tax=Luteimicrobium sp. NPDC057192 TaxID=3346042 RepID=UPI00363812B0
MTATDEGQRTEVASVFVERIEVRNFRGISECAVGLAPKLTLLVGRNNAGKSRLLRALAVALGAVPAERDDLTVGVDGPATIDLVLAPDGGEEFDDRVGRRLTPGVAIVSEEPVRERFAFRTVLEPSREGFGVRSRTVRLVFDERTSRWEAPERAETLTAVQRGVVVADLVQPRRDLDDELRRRGSAVRRVLDDLEVDPSTRVAIEERLSDVGAQILSSSAALGAVTEALRAMDDAVGGIGTPRLEPLPLRLEELSRSVAINLDAGSGSLPIRFHGAGVRSLASLQVQSVLYDRRVGRDGPALRPHPLSLVEEPETHLHPQAQFELAHLLTAMSGQVVVTTHSSHLVTEVDPAAVRLLRPAAGGALEVVDLGPGDEQDRIRARRPRMHAAELEKLKRLVERPFGELLFASAIVLGDGATERALLPPLLRHALGSRVHGVCVVDTGSLESELATAVVKFARLANLPVVVFADSDEPGRRGVERLGLDAPDVVWVSDTAAGGAATEQMLLDHDPELCNRACEAVVRKPNESTLNCMKRHKGVMGRFLAQELVALGDWDAVRADGSPIWPEPVRQLVRRLAEVLPLPKEAS